MKHMLILTALPFLVFSATADEVKSTLRFSNNDRLSGSVESLTPTNLVWKSPVFSQPTPFFLKDVIDLTLVPELPEITATHEASVVLTNGDILYGQLTSLADGTVELQTSFAGVLKLNRLMIASIQIRERQNLIYHGPSGLDDWHQSGGNPAWSYERRSFCATKPGGIAKDIKLPDECSISFDAVWSGSISLDLAFFSKELTTDRPTSGYRMRFQQRTISLLNCKSQTLLGNVSGSPNAAPLQENEKARIEVRASLKSGKIGVLVDGLLVHTWTDPNVVRSDNGRILHFINPNAAVLQISHIEVAPWDTEATPLIDPQAGLVIPGEQEDETPRPPPAEKPKPGRMELRNGDSVEGEITAITGDLVTLKTPFREIKLPIGAFRSVTLKPADLERCKRERADVRGWFPDGSTVVFRFDGVNDKTLTGYSQNFGTAPFRISTFSRIEFNIYEPKFELIRGTNGF